MSWSYAIRSFIPTPRVDHTQWRESSKVQAENLIFASQRESAEQEAKTQQENNREAIVQGARQLSESKEELRVEQRPRTKESSTFPLWLQREETMQNILRWAKALDPTEQIKKILTSKDFEISSQDLDCLSRRATPSEVVELILNLFPTDKYQALLKLFSNRKANSYLENLVEKLENLGYSDPALTLKDDYARASCLGEEELAAWCGVPQHN
jgi:HSP90 family molecular chaperone